MLYNTLKAEDKPKQRELIRVLALFRINLKLKREVRENIALWIAVRR